MGKRLTKLAIVMQCASTGGLRYCLRLVEGLAKVRPDLQITCYLGAQVGEVFGDEATRKAMESFGVMCRNWPNDVPAYPKHKLRLDKLFRYHRGRKKYSSWLKHLNDYEVVFFAWPYSLECPCLDTQIAFIPHDFNYTHSFGTFGESPESAVRQLAQHRTWLKHAAPLVSSNFIAGELRRVFPDYAGKILVIPLARLSQQHRMPDEEAKRIVSGLDVRGDYLLSVNNASHHKNLGQLFCAFHYVRALHSELSLVLIGHNTAGLGGNANTPWYLDQTDKVRNVVSLGLRSDKEVSALMQCSKMVINPSLYEAGNGSGLDAWAIGTPVVMSDIPPFREHIQTLNVQAELFHPRCCFELRDAILRTLHNTDQVATRIETSRKSMACYGWDIVASKYLEAFDEMLNSALVNKHSVCN